MGNLFKANKEGPWTLEKEIQFSKEMLILRERDRKLDEIALGKPPVYEDLRGVNGFVPVEFFVDGKTVGDPFIEFDDDNIYYQYIKLEISFLYYRYIQLYRTDENCIVSFRGFSKRKVRKYKVEFFINKKVVFVLDGNKEMKKVMDRYTYDRFNYIKITKI